MGDFWLAALGLMLVLEGIMPFLLPAAWKDTLRKVVQFQDGQIRFIGLTLMLGGLLLIFWVK
jgi:uncharacterized protein YjeT (DUF2065 family)